jgi:phospholipase A1
MKILTLLLFGTLVASAARSAETASTLMPPAGRITPGATVQLDLVTLNPGPYEVPFTAPARLAGRLETNGESRSVTLEGATAAPLAVPPQGFAVRHYQLVLPDDIRDRVMLTVYPPHTGALHTVLQMDDRATVPAAPPVTPLTQIAAAAPVSSALARTFAGRFLPNQPIYFLYGSGLDQAVKFQFSFDYRLATLHLGQADRPTLSSIRVGYTQRSLWDIEAASSPFYDTSYMPEVAVVTESPLPVAQPSWITWMGIRAGYQHESNGRDGDDSRSMNRAYFRARFILGSLDSWYVVMLPEVHAYVGGLGANPRIKDYRGYGRLQFYIGHGQDLTLRVNVWAGKDFDHPSFQLDLTYPLRLRSLNLESFLQVQYFNGYGESLRAYDRKTDSLRLGVALVR